MRFPVSEPEGEGEGALRIKSYVYIIPVLQTPLKCKTLLDAFRLERVGASL